MQLAKRPDPLQMGLRVGRGWLGLYGCHLMGQLYRAEHIYYPRGQAYPAIFGSLQLVEA